MSAVAPAVIRDAQPDDITQWLQLESLFPTDRLSARNLRRLLRSASAHLMVTMQGTQMLGNLVLLTRRGSRRARIYSIVVSPHARGMGLGTRLVEAAKDRARAAACTMISLEVRADNHAALALYRKLGFEIASTLPAYYEDGADGQRLQKTLTAPEA